MGAGGARPRVTIVSPHFDDAPLSLGQSLLDGRLSGCRVTVRVIFGRTNWTRWVHPTESRARPIGAWRRAEETASSVRFGYRFGADSWEESILRTGDMDPDHFRDPSIDVDHDPLVGPIAHRIRTLRWTADLVLVPAGIGDHIDHRIVAAAAMRLANEDPAGLAFYEDRPYVTFMDDESRAASLRRLRLELTPEDVSGPIRERTHRWLRVCYPSQIDDLFVESMVRDRERGAHEQIWFPAGSTPPWTHESLGGVAPGSPSGSAA